MLRRVAIALSSALLLGCQAEVPREASSTSCDADAVVSAVELSSEGVPVVVCGEGAVMITGLETGSSSATELTIALDERGTLSSAEGRAILAVTDTGVGMVPMVVSSADAPPVATQRVRVALNLDRDQSVSARRFDPNDPNGTSDFSTSQSIVAPTGQLVPLEVYFLKVAGGSHSTWEARVMTYTDRFYVLGEGLLTFDAFGELSESVWGPVAAPWIIDGAQAHLDIDVVATSRRESSFASSFNDDGQSASPVIAHLLTAEGEVVTEYEDGRRRVWGDILESEAARVGVILP